MKLKGIRRLLICCLLLGSMGVSAQVTFITKVDPDIVVGEPFEVKYILQGSKKFNQFNIPPMSEFRLEEVYDLPAGEKYNDVLNRIEEVLTRVVVLTPVKKGAAWIPGATVEVNGKPISSNRVRVNVGSADTPGDDSQEVEDASALMPGEDIDKKVRENFFLTASISKSSCYVGEPLMAVYKACSRLNARSQVSKRPSFTGFSVVEMVDGYDAEPSVEAVNGKNYYVHLVRKVQLFPLQAGKYVIDDAQVESVIQFVKDASNVTTMFDPSGQHILRHAVTISSKTLPVEVKPLPEDGQPADFNGAVGNYTVTASTDRHKVELGDQLKYKLTVQGKGNFPLITAPDIRFPEGVDKGEVAVTEQLNPYQFPLSGSKTFEYLIALKKPGLLTIPAISFSFFDPADKKYHTVLSNPVDVIVEEAGKNAAPTAPLVQQPAVPRQYYWFALIGAGIVGWILIQLLRARKPKAPVPVIPAEPVVVEPAFHANEAYERGDHREFLRETQRLLYYRISRRYQLSQNQLNRNAVGPAMLAAGAEPELVKRIESLLASCEWQLYTPATQQEEVDAIKVESESLLSALNNDDPAAGNIPSSV